MKVVTTFEELEGRYIQKDFVNGSRKSIYSETEMKSLSKITEQDPCELTEDNKFYNLREKLHPFIPMIICKMLDIIMDENEDTKNIIRCIENILDRYDGRPTERVEIQASKAIDLMRPSEIYQNILMMRDKIPANSSAKTAVIVSAIKEAEKIK